MTDKITWTTEQRKLGDLKAWDKNPRQLSDHDAKNIKQSMDTFGLADPLIVNTDNTIIGGHMRKRVIGDNGHVVDVRVPSRQLTDREVEELNIRLNRNSGEFDFDILANEFEVDDLLDWGFTEYDLEIGGFDLDEDRELEARQSLAERFIVPPFSVLDARQGYWQERKRAWIDLGIDSELGRKQDALGYKNSPASMGRIDTSIFDPVLAEVSYRWFCPPVAKILDPFAGGSVRGIVAERLGYKYTGVELRAEQVEANVIQADNLGVNPTWIIGNAIKIKELAEGEYDFIFSCPPYYDLEVYSDLDGELSALTTYEEFIEQYNKIVAEAMGMLKDNRFACFVVGDIRDNKGFYRNFVSDTITAFRDAGAVLYNEAILVTMVASLSMRAGRFLLSNRKLGKTHQNVLVFYKGNPKAIRDNFPEIVIDKDEWAEMTGDTPVLIE